MGSLALNSLLSGPQLTTMEAIKLLLVFVSIFETQGLFQFWRPKREMKELDNCGKRYVGKKSNKDKRDCLWDCEWIKNPLYSGDTQRDFIPLSQYSNLDALPEDVLLYYQHIGNEIAQTDIKTKKSTAGLAYVISTPMIPKNLNCIRDCFRYKTRASQMCSKLGKYSFGSLNSPTYLSLCYATVNFLESGRKERVVRSRHTRAAENFTPAPRDPECSDEGSECVAESECCTDLKCFDAGDSTKRCQQCIADGGDCSTENGVCCSSGFTCEVPQLTRGPFVCTNTVTTTTTTTTAAPECSNEGSECEAESECCTDLKCFDAGDSTNRCQKCIADGGDCSTENGVCCSSGFTCEAPQLTRGPFVCTNTATTTTTTTTAAPQCTNDGGTCLEDSDCCSDSKCFEAGDSTKRCQQCIADGGDCS